MFGSSFDRLAQRASLFSGGSTRTGLAIGRAQMEPFVPDAEISITAAPKTVQILPGAPTNVWSYEGQLLSADRA